MTTTPEPNAELPTSRTQHLVAFAVFLAVLLSPWMARLVGVSSESIENRALTEFPDFSRENVDDPATFAQIGDYVRDRTPLRPQAIDAMGRVGHRLGYSASPSIMFGENDMMFLTKDFVNPCVQRYKPAALVKMFEQWDDAAALGNKAWRFVVAPDKAAAMEPQLTGRTKWAFSCASKSWAEMNQAVAGFEEVVNLLPPLQAAEATDPGSTYFTTNSHWNPFGGGIAASVIVDSFVPGLWSDEHVVLADSPDSLPADVPAQMGLDLPLTQTIRTTHRPGTTTELEQVDVGASHLVRVYRSAGELPMIDGTTVVVHDSMITAMEKQIAPYFEELVFIHWNDREEADFLGRVASADNVIFETVGRSASQRLSVNFVRRPYLDRFLAALATSS